MKLGGRLPRRIRPYHQEATFSDGIASIVESLMNVGSSCLGVALFRAPLINMRL